MPVAISSLFIQFLSAMGTVVGETAPGIDVSITVWAAKSEDAVHDRQQQYGDTDRTHPNVTGRRTDTSQDTSDQTGNRCNPTVGAERQLL